MGQGSGVETGAGEPGQDVRGPLRLPSFRWFFAGRLISLLGSSMAPIALSLAVLNISNSVTDMGIVLTAHTIPLIAFALAGGVAGDRFSRKAVLLISNLGAGLSQGIAAGVLISGNVHLALLTVLELGNGTLTAFTGPALRGVVPDLVRRDQMRRANSLLSSAKNGTKILGPAVGALIVVGAGGGWAIAIDAATYFVAAVCLARLRLTAGPPPRKASAFADVREGWRAFSSRSWIWGPVGCFAVVNFVNQGSWMVLGPVLARESIGETSWGVVLSVRAAGVLVMAIVMYRVVLRRLLGVAQACVVLGALPLVALGLHAGVFWLAAATLLAGLGTGLYGVAWETSLQEHVPENLLSRISSYDNLGSFVAIPAGQLCAAPFAAAYGATTVVLAGGIVYAVFAVLPLAVPAVRGLRHTG